MTANAQINAETEPSAPASSLDPSMQGLRDVIDEWWCELTGADPSSTRRGSTGERAALKRAHGLEDVVLCLGYHDLVRRASHLPRISQSRLALVAGVLAHVEERATSQRSKQRPPSFARQMADASGRDRSPVSAHRFLRVLRLRERDDRLLSAIRRLVALCGKQAHVGRLGLDLYWWNEKTRKQWALDYFEVAPKMTGRGQ